MTKQTPSAIAPEEATYETVDGGLYIEVTQQQQGSNAYAQNRADGVTHTLNPCAERRHADDVGGGSASSATAEPAHYFDPTALGAGDSTAIRSHHADGQDPPLSQPGTVGYWAAPHGRQRQSKEAGHGDEAGAYDHLRQVSESSYDEPNYGVVNPPTVADTAASYDDVISGTAGTPVYHSPAPATVDQHGYDLMSECRERHRAMARSRSRSRNDTYNAAVDLGESSDDSDHGGGSDRAYGERYDGEGAEPAPGAHAGNPANESTTHDGGSVTETYAVAKSVAVTHSNIGTDADAYDEVSAAGAGPAPVYHTQPADEQGCRMAATLGGIVTSPTALSLTEHQHGYDVIPDVKNSSPAGDSDEIYTEIDASKEDAPVYDVIRFIPAANDAEPQYASPGQGSNDVSGV